MPGGSVPFSLEPIMVEIEEGRYIGPFLPVSLYELVAGRRSTGEGAPQIGGGGSNGDDGGGRNKKPLTKVDATGGASSRRAMTHTCPPSPFGMGRTRVSSW